MTHLVVVALLTVGYPPDYQQQADAAKWEWRDEQATVLYSTMRFHGDYQVEIVKKPNTFGSLTLRFTKDGKEALALEAHPGTTFVAKDNVLFYTNYHGSSTGCALVAFDLANRKELWKTPLTGLGPIAHTRYRNAVAVELSADAVKVLGHESAGNYIEFVDLKTGKTVGHKALRP